MLELGPVGVNELQIERSETLPIRDRTEESLSKTTSPIIITFMFFVQPYCIIYHYLVASVYMLVFGERKTPQYSSTS